MSLANIEGKLSRAEMKSINEGKVELTETRWDGQYCYCDYAITFGEVTRNECDVTCPASNCGH